MWSSWNTSNTALQQRVTETTETHNKLQSHLSKTMQEIYDQVNPSKPTKPRNLTKTEDIFQYNANSLFRKNISNIWRRPSGTRRTHWKWPNHVWRLVLIVQMLSFVGILLITELSKKLVKSKSLLIYLTANSMKLNMLIKIFWWTRPDWNMTWRSSLTHCSSIEKNACLLERVSRWCHWQPNCKLWRMDAVLLT